MKVQTLEDVAKKIFEEYEDEPQGWRIFIGQFPNDEHFLNIIVAGPQKIRQLKLESAYKPNPLVVCKEIDEYPKTKTLYFGLRPLREETLRKVFRAVSRKDSPALFEIFKSVFSAAPIAYSEFADKEIPVGLQGPVMRGPLEYISEKQQRLDAKLNAELKRVVRREYSMYG